MSLTTSTTISPTEHNVSSSELHIHGQPTPQIRPNEANNTISTSSGRTIASTITVPSSPPTEPVAEARKMSNKSTALLMTPLCLSVFLSSLDLTVVTPAIPSIVRSFNSSAGYVWIGSAFILASTAITPIWGSVADIWGRKPIILTSLALFLVGSLICAVAKTMDALIAGRAVQGLGSSGMGTMVNVIICDSFSLRDRGLYLAITSGVWAVGSGVGPVIGGSFASGIGWRWCFWINLPIGVLVVAVLAFHLRLPSPNTPALVGLKAIDWIGSVLIIGAALMILLGLDFGSVTLPWSSATIICLIVFGVLTIGIFLINEWKFAKNPVIPLRIFTNRSTIAAYVIWACNFYVLVGLSYYLPLYSQSVLGANALISGVHLIPLIVSCSVAAAGTGAFIQKTGKYLPLTFIAHSLLVLGTGLFINLKPQDRRPVWLFVAEIITGIGIGMNIEPPLLAAQAAMTVMDTAVIQATMTFMRSLATTIAVVIGGVIFQNEMNSASKKLADRVGVEVATMFRGENAAASVELIGTLSSDQQILVKDAYHASLRSVWVMFVAIAGLSLLANLFLKAHHLDDTVREAVLGADRGDQGGGQVVVVDIAEPIELQQQSSIGARHRQRRGNI